MRLVMNRAKKPLTAKEKKHQDKETRAPLQPKEAEGATTTWKILAKFPKRPAKKGKEQLDSSEKGVKAKKKKLHNCLATCGFAPFDKYNQLLKKKLVDIFLYDYKETDPKKHKEYTGVPQEQIIENLLKIDKLGAKTIICCPIVPGLNDRTDHSIGIAATANKPKNILQIDIHPYHPLGRSKSQRIGKEWQIDEVSFPSEDTVKQWRKKIQTHTKVEVK